MKKKVLMVTYGGGHVAMMVPVAKQLLKEGLDVQILALTTAASVVRQAGLPCFTMRDFLRPENVHAKRWGERLAAGVNRSTAVSYEESVAYLGLSYADLETEVGEEEAAKRYAKYGRQIFLPVRLMRRVLAEVLPDVLVATSSPRAERAAIIAAGLEGVPSVCMVDLFAAYEIEWLRAPNYANKVCVLNDFVKQKLVNAGRIDGQIYVTGNPAFDVLNESNTWVQGYQLRIQRGWERQTVVLWASQIEPLSHPARPGELGDVELPSLILNRLRQICAQYSSLVLVIRPHPSQSINIQELQPLGANEWFSGKDEALAALLHAVDVVVVMTSTVGLEAHMVNAVVVQITGSLYSIDAPYKAFGIADFESNLEELPMTLLRAVALAQQRRSVRINQCRKHEEGLLYAESSTSRVVSVLKDLL